MNRQSISSSNISSAGYDETSSTLEIEFKNGGTYQFSNVPKNIYNGLVTAKSAGQFFHREIKNRFDFKRV